MDTVHVDLHRAGEAAAPVPASDDADADAAPAFTTPAPSTDKLATFMAFCELQVGLYAQSLSAAVASRCVRGGKQLSDFLDAAGCRDSCEAARAVCALLRDRRVDNVDDAALERDVTALVRTGALELVKRSHLAEHLLLTHYALAKAHLFPVLAPAAGRRWAALASWVDMCAVTWSPWCLISGRKHTVVGSLTARFSADLKTDADVDEVGDALRRVICTTDRAGGACLVLDVQYHGRRQMMLTLDPARYEWCKPEFEFVYEPLTLHVGATRAYFEDDRGRQSPQTFLCGGAECGPVCGTATPGAEAIPWLLCRSPAPPPKSRAHPL